MKDNILSCSFAYFTNARDLFYLIIFHKVRLASQDVHSVQSSIIKPGTLEKSWWLRVTKIAPKEITIAAIRKSCVPIGIFCARRLANFVAAASLKGKTLILLKKANVSHR